MHTVGKKYCPKTEDFFIVIPNSKKPLDVKNPSASKYSIFISVSRREFHENPCWSFFRANTRYGPYNKKYEFLWVFGHS